MIWRVWVSGKASLQEITTIWTVRDIIKANMVLQARDEIIGAIVNGSLTRTSN